MDAGAIFDREIKRWARGGWTVGAVRSVSLAGRSSPVVFVIRSAGMAVWNARYHAERLARVDPLMAYGRGPNPPARTADLPASTGPARRVMEERTRAGLTDGLIVPLRPLNPGGYVTLWGVDRSVTPGSPAWIEVTGLCFWVAETADFTAADRRHVSGEQLSPREAEVCRLLLTGRTARAVADALDVRPTTVDAALDRAKARLTALDLLPAGRGARALVPVAAETFGLL